MADGGGKNPNHPTKKLNIDKNEYFRKLNDDKKEKLLDAIKALNSKETGLSMLKLVYCDAAQACCFSDSTCYLKRNPPKLFKFSSLFKRGNEVLLSYLDSGYTDLLTAAEKVSLEKLFCLLNHIEEISEKVRSPKYPIEKEIDWLLQLCHHVLKGLSRHEYYIVDDKTQYLGSVDLTKYGCPCCRQVLTGDTGDTSIGNTSGMVEWIF